MTTQSGPSFVASTINLPALAKARAEGRTLTEVVTDALLDYVGDDED